MLFNAKMALGKRVEQRIKELGLTQEEVANQVGVTQVAINNLIKRDSDSSRNTSKLAKALQTTTEWLESGKVENKATDERNVVASDFKNRKEEEALLALFRQLNAKQKDGLMLILESMVIDVVDPTTTKIKSQGNEGQS